MKDEVNPGSVVLVEGVPRMEVPVREAVDPGSVVLVVGVPRLEVPVREEVDPGSVVLVVGVPRLEVLVKEVDPGSAVLVEGVPRLEVLVKEVDPGSVMLAEDVPRSDVLVKEVPWPVVPVDVSVSVEPVAVVNPNVVVLVNEVVAGPLRNSFNLLSKSSASEGETSPFFTCFSISFWYFSMAALVFLESGSFSHSLINLSILSSNFSSAFVCCEKSMMNRERPHFKQSSTSLWHFFFRDVSQVIPSAEQQKRSSSTKRIPPQPSLRHFFSLSWHF